MVEATPLVIDRVTGLCRPVTQHDIFYMEEICIKYNRLIAKMRGIVEEYDESILFKKFK
jgi:hypothetical protein